MQRHERIGVVPVTAGRLGVDDDDVGVGLVDEGVREDHAHAAGADDQVVGLDRAHGRRREHECGHSRADLRRRAITRHREATLAASPGTRSSRQRARWQPCAQVRAQRPAVPAASAWRTSRRNRMDAKTMAVATQRASGTAGHPRHRTVAVDGRRGRGGTLVPRGDLTSGSILHGGAVRSSSTLGGRDGRNLPEARRSVEDVAAPARDRTCTAARGRSTMGRASRTPRAQSPSAA